MDPGQRAADLVSLKVPNQVPSHRGRKGSGLFPDRLRATFPQINAPSLNQSHRIGGSYILGDGNQANFLGFAARGGGSGSHLAANLLIVLPNLFGS